MHGILDTIHFNIGTEEFKIELVDNSYYGGKAVKYYCPSPSKSDSFNIDTTKQFRTEQRCKEYIIKCVKNTCKSILKES